MKPKKDSDAAALAAAQMLARRRAVRTDLAAFCRLAGFEPAKHHRLILQHLADVASGKTERLAVTLPRRRQIHLQRPVRGMVAGKQPHRRGLDHPRQPHAKFGRQTVDPRPLARD